MATSEPAPTHSDDPVIAHLQGAAEAYRDIDAQRAEDERELESARHQLAEARGHTQRLQAELDAERQGFRIANTRMKWQLWRA